MKHILIDYENVQPTNLDGIEFSECHIWLFLGVHQQKQLPLELIETLLMFNSKNVHIVKMQHSGKNALDFYLSFYLGKISEIDPQADVCILARDSGYDVLVKHLNTVYDGMDIMRLPNTNQVFLIDDMSENTIAKLAPDTLNTTETDIDTDVANVTTPKENKPSVDIASTIRQELNLDITKPFIHHCYALVFNKLIQPNAFLPSCQHNLLSAMQKYVLADELQAYDTATKLYVAKQVFAKLQKYGLIHINEQTNKLDYHLDAESILQLIKSFVLQSQATTIDKLHNIIRQRLRIYQQPETDADINLVVKWLKNEGAIKQQNQSINYPTIDAGSDTKKHEEKTSQKNATKKNLETNVSTTQQPPSQKNIMNELYQKAITSLKSRPDKSRPAKRQSLENHLKSHLRVDDDAIKRLIQKLFSTKVIAISTENKLIYHL